MAVEHREPGAELDRQFWIVTALIAIASLAWIAFALAWDITKVLPEAVRPADLIDALFRFLLAASGVVFIVVTTYVVYFSLRYRRRADDPPDAIGIQIHDHHALELWWTIIPTVLLVALGIFSVRIFSGIYLEQPTNGLTVEAIGHQWYFDFRYPGINGVITDEMHLPLGVPVTLHVTSQDVIHSFWIPADRIKADMVPGLINTLHFTPTHPGTYKIICTEFCGTLHSDMNKQIMVVQDDASFKKWYEGWKVKNAHASNALPGTGVSSASVNLAGGSAANGQKLFTSKCIACHGTGAFDAKVVGPGLKNVLHDPAHPQLLNGTPANEDDVAKLIKSGFTGAMGHMPSEAENSLSDKDIADLVAFLNTYK
ncbi:MAG: cytochrome c oxidase subunit II [Candidatus Eremiobacteraeota bacterium]|nr:cytochrome c oxidase subunit II [Candidatus Eremiobacteraeota bacterium]